MESKSILAATSLFYNQRKWPSLLQAIQTFNSTIYKKPSYYLEFNYASGQNIRFLFLVKENDADQLLEQADHYFKSFFLHAKSDPPKLNGEIFKAFDENNIYYGLYDPIIIKKEDIIEYSSKFTLSKYMIEALRNEHYLDDETILTLAYYFSITIIKIAIELLPAIRNILIMYFKKSYFQSEMFDNKLIQTKFGENKNILLEILNSVGTTDAPFFIKKWKNYISKQFGTLQKEELETKIFPLIDQIKVQLGLNSAMKSMLFYFIFRTLSIKPKSAGKIASKYS